MAKESGLGWTTCSVDDAGGSARAIVNDVTSLTISTPSETQEITGIDKSAFERLILLADAVVTLNGVFNPASDMSHDVFRTVGVTSVARTVTLTHSGQTLAMELLFNNYRVVRGPDGSLVWSAPGQLQSGTVPSWS
jgi:hypothetical protein